MEKEIVFLILIISCCGVQSQAGTLKCTAGQANFRDQKCQDCDYDTYQPKNNPTPFDSCLPCDSGTGTKTQGTKLKADCLTQCYPGQGMKTVSSACEDCPRGTWNDGSRVNRFGDCRPCSNGKTTEKAGATGQGYCTIPKCEAGQVIRGGQCSDCPEDTYQPEQQPTGFTRCVHCPPNTGTKGVKSNSSTSCVPTCSPGQGINTTTSTCVTCPRGTWNNGNKTMHFEACVKCPDDTTTKTTGASSDSFCNIPICEKGFVIRGGVCTECPVDTYQDIDQPLESTRCKQCPSNTGTLNNGSVSPADCKQTCSPGQGKDKAGSTCTKCPRGTWNDGSVTNRFQPCTHCPPNFTTDLQDGANSKISCNIPTCKAGKVISPGGKTCTPCPMDTYQPNTLPFLKDICLQCPPGRGTQQTEADSVAKCVQTCKAGQSLVNGTCVKCPRGTWNNGSTTMRFKDCEKCPTAMTTDVVEGAINGAACNIPSCKAGQVVRDGKCTDCSVDQYQDIPSPFSKTTCLPCPQGTGTIGGGVKNVTKCVKICLPGQQLSRDGSKCGYCDRGTWNNGNATMRFDKCVDCPKDMTTEVPTGAASEATCYVRVCKAGQKLKDGVCTDCPINTYQPLTIPFQKTTCTVCPDGTGTRQNGTGSVDGCVHSCLEGQESNSTTSCIECPRGFWNNGNASMQFEKCAPCPGGFTTRKGSLSTSMDNCTISACDAGYIIQGGKCEVCPKNTYQNVSSPFEDTQCIQCDEKERTKENGTTSVEDCIRICLPGQELKNNVCTDCSRGTWHDGSDGMQFDQCSPCPTEYTTKDGDAAKSKDECVVPACDAGYVIEKGQCVACPMDEYQDSDTPFLTTKCSKCNVSTGTNHTAANSSSDCLPVCNKGEEMDNGTCVACSRGFWNNGNYTMRFEECATCPDDMTTNLDSGATKESDCNIPICSTGYVVENGNCSICPFDTYQPEDTPHLNVKCMYCSNTTGTNHTGANSSHDCLPKCPAGQELDSDGSCSLCSRGFWNNGSLTMRFEECAQCEEGVTTENKNGSTQLEYCNIPICHPGHVIAGDDCNQCERDEYQPIDEPYSYHKCISCAEGFGTHDKGSTDGGNCSRICKEGQGLVNDTCVDCSRGSWNNGDTEMRFKECVSCPNGNTTELSSRATNIDNCNIPICSPGEVIENGNCVKCPLDSYSTVNIPFSNATCIKCDGQTGTNYIGATSKDACKIRCLEGHGLRNGSCVPCERGTWNNANTTMRFEDCAKCPAHNTTNLMGKATSLNDCNIPICEAGNVIEDGKCKKCPLDTFQPIVTPFLATICTSCQAKMGTRHKGTANGTDCTALCDPGYHLTPNGTSCGKCPRGTWNNGDTIMRFRTSCASCPANTTTEKKLGAFSEDDCIIAKCTSGQYIKNGVCTSCPIDTYQPIDSPYLTTYCTKCDGKMGTKDVGSKFKSDCVPKCQARQGLVNNTCVPCARGTWNNGNETMRYEQCAQCQDNTTTEFEHGASKPSDCNIPSCQAGFYIENGNCLKCPLDTYQEDEVPYLTTTCKRCGEKMGTARTGATSLDECTLMCHGGQGLVNGTACEACPRGTWNDGDTKMRFEPCETCPKNKTTEIEEGASKKIHCNIPICQAGQKIENGDCVDCPFDTFQPNDLPYLTTECVQCQETTGTQYMGTVNETDCKPKCLEGQNLVDNDGKCDGCPRGTWNNASTAMRFEQCAKCPENTTTELTTGALRPDQCNIPLCQAGYYIQGNTCKACPKDTYQELREPYLTTVCVKCGPNTGTNHIAAISSKDCLTICPQGNQLGANGTCVPCPRGTWNNGNATMRFKDCVSCPKPHTTELDEGASSERQCSIRKCEAGQVVYRTNWCQDCPFHTYQPIDPPYMTTTCKRCPPNTETDHKKATSLDACIAVIPPDAVTTPPMTTNLDGKATILFEFPQSKNNAAPIQMSFKPERNETQTGLPWMYSTDNITQHYIYYNMSNKVSENNGLGEIDIPVDKLIDEENSTVIITFRYKLSKGLKLDLKYQGKTIWSTTNATGDHWVEATYSGPVAGLTSMASTAQPQAITGPFKGATPTTTKTIPSSTTDDTSTTATKTIPSSKTVTSASTSTTTAKTIPSSPNVTSASAPITAPKSVPSSASMTSTVPSTTTPKTIPGSTTVASADTTTTTAKNAATTSTTNATTTTIKTKTNISAPTVAPTVAPTTTTTKNAATTATTNTPTTLPANTSTTSTHVASTNTSTTVTEPSTTTVAKAPIAPVLSRTTVQVSSSGTPKTSSSRRKRSAPTPHVISFGLSEAPGSTAYTGREEGFALKSVQVQSRGHGDQNPDK